MSCNSEQGEVVRLLMEHRSSLFAYILAIVRDYDAAEDILQEVSVAVCEAGQQFRPGTNFGAWVREIARRRILAHHRVSLRLPASMTDEALQRLDSGFDRADSHGGTKDRIDALRRCLDSLTQALRTCIERQMSAMEGET